ncbi:MAG TPA: cell filamentation protein Fic [Planctomycetaceae bacterium]|nr:cell filamentation protein Fic [Gimesia sp.]HAH47760.1 cell filamentation protein Fic [Planctomycetaceae bacterium]
MNPYLPDPLPIEVLDISRLIRRIGPANAAIARYDGLLQSVVNPSVMLSPLTNREAVLSSKIEGTQATVDEVLEYEAGMEFDQNKTDDIQEVVNYRKTLTLASETLKTYPLSLSLIQQMHKLLMDSVRGANKSPGDFRKDQNWLGSHGCTIEQAKFVPPSPLQLNDYLIGWQEYIAGEDIDALVQCAIVHAQFELLHPFKDGNGRIGRLLIPLFLFQKKVLATPMFYLSEYLEANRDTYYDRLQGISDHRDWTGWVEFFLGAVTEQSLSNTTRVRGILNLYEKMKSRITDITHSQYALAILDAIFDRPIFQSADFCKRSQIPKPTATAALRKLKDAKILLTVREGRGRRPAVYAFSELLNIAEGREIL